MENNLSLLENKKQICNKIQELEDCIKKYRKKLRDLNLTIFDSCKHKWVHDNFCAFDDIIKQYCESCGLWRRRNLYV